MKKSRRQHNYDQMKTEAKLILLFLLGLTFAAVIGPLLFTSIGFPYSSRYKRQTFNLKIVTFS